jgi:hypothetical protein
MSAAIYTGRIAPNGGDVYRVKAWRWPNEDGQSRPYFQPVFHTTWYAADFPNQDDPSDARNPAPLALEMADMFWIDPLTGKLDRRPK